MPFGLHNAPATFQCTMKDCQQFSGAHIDDIVVFREEHLQHLHEVFSQCQQAGLPMKLSKCRFGQREVFYHGHVIGGGKIRHHPRKVEAVRIYPQPEDILSLVGYYQHFIPQFVAIAAPLTDLTRKVKPHKMEWGADQERAFQQLKHLLIQGPILRVANPSRPYILQADASDLGLGAVLSQCDEDGGEHQVAYICEP